MRGNFFHDHYIRSIFGADAQNIDRETLQIVTNSDQWSEMWATYPYVSFTEGAIFA